MKIPFIYSFSGSWSPSVPLSTFMCLWAIYIFTGSVHIFSCTRIGRSIVGINESLTDTWMSNLRLWPRNFFSGNICFKFSLLFLYSVRRILLRPEYFIFRQRDSEVSKKYSRIKSANSVFKSGWLFFNSFSRDAFSRVLWSQFQHTSSSTRAQSPESG